MSNNYETTYSKTIIINIKENSLSHRRSPIHLTIEQSSISTPLVQREIHIRLTDDKDPFFLYNLLITEADFLALKQQQGLLVDFPAFPQKFMDLLEQCLQEQNKELPRFLLTLTLQGKLGMDGGPGLLEVVEANPFKHLVHLGLKVCPASDQHIKKYLAKCLQTFMEENNLLKSRLSTVEHELQSRTRRLEDKLKDRTQEVESLQLEMERKMGMQAATHREELARQREIQETARRQEENKLQIRRNEIETELKNKLHIAESQLAHFQHANRDLQEKAHRFERLNQEQKQQLTQREDATQKNERVIQEQKGEKYNLDLKYHELNQTVSQLRLRISTLESKLEEKDHQLEREMDLNIRNAEESRKWDERLKEKQDLIAKREGELRTMSTDLNKSNDLLRRVKDELKTFQSKIKMKDRVTISQEKSISDIKADLSDKEQRLLTLTTCLNQKNDQITELKEQVAKLSTELEDSNSKLRSKESVNRWLNKQLVDSKPQQTPLPHPQTTFRNGHIPGQANLFSPITPPVPMRPPLYQSTAIPRQPFRSSLTTPSHSIPHYNPGADTISSIRHFAPYTSTTPRPSSNEVVS